MYGLHITIEEIRRNGLIEITEENLPSLDTIFDEGRDLTAKCNMDMTEEFLKEFKN